MAKPWHMQRLLNTSFSFSLCILWFPAVPCVLSVDPCNIGYVSNITQISSIIKGLYTWHSVNSMMTKFFRNPLGVNLIVSSTINLMPTVPIFKFLAVTIMVLGLIDMMYRFLRTLWSITLIVTFPFQILNFPAVTIMVVKSAPIDMMNRLLRSLLCVSLKILNFVTASVTIIMVQILRTLLSKRRSNLSASVIPTKITFSSLSLSFNLGALSAFSSSVNKKE